MCGRLSRYGHKDTAQHIKGARYHDLRHLWVPTSVGVHLALSGDRFRSCITENSSQAVEGGSVDTGVVWEDVTGGEANCSSRTGRDPDLSRPLPVSEGIPKQASNRLLFGLMSSVGPAEG